MFPGILASPRFVSGFARFGYHTKAPFLVSGLCIECRDVAANPVFAAAGPSITLSRRREV
jgi:hypothetical protein